jgi:dipeptidyl-peptidase-4
MHILWITFCIVFAPHAHADRLTIDRVFGAPDLSGPGLRNPQISPDGKLITYLKGRDDDKDRLDLWAYDVAAKRHRLLVDSRALTGPDKALSAEEEARRERQRTAALSGIIEYSFASDSRSLLVPLNGDLYLYDLRAPAARAVRRLTTSEAYETDAKFSPGGKYVSFVRDQNLWVIELASGREIAITTEGGGLVSFGMAEFIAQEEMDRDTGYWWSPDDTRLVVARVDESPVAELERFEIYADNVKVIRQRYPAAGAANAHVSLFVAAVAGGARIPLDLGANPDIYIPRVNWLPDSMSVAVQRQSRDQRLLELLKFDTSTGASRLLLTERSDTWVPLHDDLTFLKKSAQFLWTSVRSGFKHLYLYDLEGNLLRQLTSGEWMLAGDSYERVIRALDENTRTVYVMANLETPIERHLYAVSLDRVAAPTRITRGSGWHSVRMATDGAVFVDTFSTPNDPPSVVLRDRRGNALATLVANALDAKHPYAPFVASHITPEFGTLRAEDGQTLHYKLMKPTALAPGKRYPVIVDVYGGPGVQRVQKAWGGLLHQYWVQQGYIVFALDNRGSGFRGVEFETALYRKMGSVEVRDQVAGVEYLRTLPYVDPKRVGVWGWSYGGYMALMCIMQAPEHFAAAVSGAPVTDWHLYDTHYTERYMSTPTDNPKGYAAGSVLGFADNLRAPLLLIHGMADDNVLFTNSTSLMKRLQDLQKPFDVMTYPGAKHGLIRQATTARHAYAQIERFFAGALADD